MQRASARFVAVCEVVSLVICMVHLPMEARGAESASVRFFSTAGEGTTVATFEGGSSSRTFARQLNQSHHDGREGPTRLHKSTTTSRIGCEQQTRRLPLAGFSSGSGP